MDIFMTWWNFLSWFYDVNIITTYKTFFQNLIKSLSIIYQNKTRMPGKKEVLAYLWEVAIFINYTVFEYRFW